MLFVTDVGSDLKSVALFVSEVLATNSVVVVLSDSVKACVEWLSVHVDELACDVSDSIADGTVIDSASVVEETCVQSSVVRSEGSRHENLVYARKRVRKN